MTRALVSRHGRLERRSRARGSSRPDRAGAAGRGSSSSPSSAVTAMRSETRRRGGPALDDVAIRLTRDQLIRQVIQGGGNMPAYGKNLIAGGDHGARGVPRDAASADTSRRPATSREPAAPAVCTASPGTHSPDQAPRGRICGPARSPRVLAHRRPANDYPIVLTGPHLLSRMAPALAPA